MTPIIEDTVLGNHLDCQNLNLLNVGQMFPVPANLIGVNDPSLGDQRVPPIGSVTDFHVDAVAGIVQSKLLFDGPPPSEWLGGVSGQIAAGELVELQSRKGAPNGYAALGTDGKIPASNVPLSANPGTVTDIRFLFPPEFVVTQGTAPDSVCDAQWDDVPDGSWFGVNGGVGLNAVIKPSFLLKTLPPELMPDIDAAKFTSGVFSPEVLPETTDTTHGMVPDPGFVGLPTDYLGRDMEWHTTPPEAIGMPTAPMPVITLDSWSDKEVIVTVRSALPDSSLFTLLQKYPDYTSPGFSLAKMKNDSDEDVHITMTVNDRDILWAYAAKDGYNNSGFVTNHHDPGYLRVNPYFVLTPLTIPPYPFP